MKPITGPKDNSDLVKEKHVKMLLRKSVIVPP